ncbi:hypothetical protein Ait01nite_032430 [Actinoplanes italicus]|uniref:Uncharacterized protein n=1 Tax=Actinoplanes italicus TaxID=113567 RepID=A0A2T0KK54_9ACTN|nr:hypothetical protein CLV67_103445 [Actinoplanes italicus]GIE30198.1 hypothetical protein Ait01nite_032430 [Actinoplanes italicus]
MRPHVGAEVTVVPTDDDPYILQFQRFAIVSRRTDHGAYVRLSATYPPGREFGPIPDSRLLFGWRDPSGAWRRW